MKLPELSLFDTDPAERDVDAVVIGLHARDGDDTTPGEADLLVGTGGESIAAAFEGRLTGALRVLGATGNAGEVIRLATLGTITAPLLVAVGLGREPAGAAPTPEVLRRAVGSAVRALAGHPRVALALPVPDDPGLAPVVRVIGEGALLGGYRFDRYRSTPPRRSPVASVAVHVPDAGDVDAGAEVRRAGDVARAVTQARDWVNTPPNDLRPPEFADQVARVADNAGLEVSVLGEKELRQAGYGGILAVGQGSEAPPRLVRLAYRPPSGTGAVRVALVGKGVTFDSGGVSIKPSQGMWEMKTDMAGAAAVASTMLAVAALRPDAAVTAWLPMVENLPSGTAYRPGDVLTMYNGRKVEVFNTDAEGRLILADAIARACEEEPEVLLETSTLTGGQVVSLGKRVAGVMGTPALCEQVRRAGDVTGEPAWPMPLPDDVRQGMESAVADIAQTNVSQERVGTMLQGGIFLSEFVAGPVTWAHLDIAGPAYHSGEPVGYLSKGATGIPVRTLLHVIEDLVASGVG